MHDSAPPTPAQDLVVEVDEQLEENDNGVDDSDEHMDGVEVTGEIGGGKHNSENGEGSSCGGEEGDYGYEDEENSRVGEEMDSKMEEVDKFPNDKSDSFADL